VTASLPLAGVVVADYSQYVAGPFCTLLLADLGADVVKVEPPQGDQWRRQEPCGGDLNKPFVVLNRNKKSVVLDLKSDEGRRASAELIAQAEVVIHNSPSQRALAFGLEATVRGMTSARRRPLVFSWRTRGSATRFRSERAVSR